jgi:hypothetical protein
LSTATIRLVRMDSSEFYDVEDLDPLAEARRQIAATAAKGARDGKSLAVLRRVLADLDAIEGVYTVTPRDAAHMNLAVDLPDQPAYDWTGVLDEDDE